METDVVDTIGVILNMLAGNAFVIAHTTGDSAQSKRLIVVVNELLTHRVQRILGLQNTTIVELVSVRTEVEKVKTYVRQIDRTGETHRADRILEVGVRVEGLRRRDHTSVRESFGKINKGIK